MEGEGLAVESGGSGVVVSRGELDRGECWCGGGSWRGGWGGGQCGRGVAERGGGGCGQGWAREGDHVGWTNDRSFLSGNDFDCRSCPALLVLAVSGVGGAALYFISGDFFFNPGALF